MYMFFIGIHSNVSCLIHEKFVHTVSIATCAFERITFVGISDLYEPTNFVSTFELRSLWVSILLWFAVGPRP